MQTPTAAETNAKEELKQLYQEMDYGCEYSDNLPGLLSALNISLAFTSYQAGRLMLVRTDGDSIDVNFTAFPRPMGLACQGDSLTLGTFTQVIQFSREDHLLPQLKQPLPGIDQDITAPKLHRPTKADTPTAPEQPALTEEQLAHRKEQQAFIRQQFAPLEPHTDACFITRSSHHTGMINIHDIAWGSSGLWAVNSSFSCLCTLDSNYSFVPRWQPHFISELTPEDRCHLNGMTLRDGQPRYVTTFSTSDQPGKWRDSDKSTGTLMDVQSNEFLLQGLMMPHSPRWHDGNLYVCESGHGLFCRYNFDTGEKQVVAELPGFTRGVDFIGPIAIVGLSKVRQSDVSRPAPLAQKYPETHSGLWFIDLRSAEVIGTLSFTGNVDQIYDVAVLPDCTFPALIEPHHPRMRNHFTFSELQPL
ncbi:TIGR03032 family protein [Ferrimonas pelagia]|uniref:Conserved hypothetical protein CHP03032 domain-containing protein n=1 Tax=Ferrimonas pelagia TaxID=1177826 RepID=A0ABP9EF90_9GAMM